MPNGQGVTRRKMTLSLVSAHNILYSRHLFHGLHHHPKRSTKFIYFVVIYFVVCQKYVDAMSSSTNQSTREVAAKLCPYTAAAVMVIASSGGNKMLYKDAMKYQGFSSEDVEKETHRSRYRRAKKKIESEMAEIATSIPMPMAMIVISERRYATAVKRVCSCT